MYVCMSMAIHPINSKSRKKEAMYVIDLGLEISNNHNNMVAIRYHTIPNHTILIHFL